MDWYYMRQGYALLATNSDSDGHRFGGKPYHAGAKCPICKVPLLLVADLNCIPFRKRERAQLFHELNRLPLYYCWRCAADQLSYRVLGPDKIKVLRNNGRPQGEGFPYAGFPIHFHRTPVKVIPIRYETAKLLAISQEVDGDWLSEDDKSLRARNLKRLRHSGFSSRDTNRHQIGGLVRLIQGHERVGCPNKKCEQSRRFENNYSVRMKELAVIHNDPRSGLPMIEPPTAPGKKSHFNEWVQLVYWICEECLTIAVSNRCD